MPFLTRAANGSPLYTRDVLTRWAETGGRVFFICLNFAVDCLETLYDIDHELKPFYFDQIKQAGRTPGEESFTYVHLPRPQPPRAPSSKLSDVLRPHIEGGLS